MAGPKLGPSPADLFQTTPAMPGSGGVGQLFGTDDPEIRRRVYDPAIEAAKKVGIGAVGAIVPGAAPVTTAAQFLQGAPPATEPKIENATVIPDRTGMITDEQLSALDQMDASRRATPRFPTLGLGQQGVWTPASHDMAVYGGEQGEQNYEQAFDISGTEDALMRKAQIEEAGEARKAEVLGQTAQRERSAMAAAAARRAEMQQEYSARQAEIDATAQMYTADLANQNKFWQNPGNIISSIALSLMPIFGGDPAAGAKLINQNIERDMANRRAVADTHMGALRSNLSAYRQMMGDVAAGDALAMSEAHRIAAMEIERVGAQMKSETAKQNAAILSEEFKRKSAEGKINAYRLGYMGVTKMAPGQLEAYRKNPYWKVFGNQASQAPMEALGATPPGTPYSASRSLVPGTASPTSANVTGKPSSIDPKEVAEMSYGQIGARLRSGQFSPDQVIDAIGVKNQLEALRMNPTNPNKALAELEGKINEGVAKIAESNKEEAQRQRILSDTSRSLEKAIAWVQSRGGNPDDLLQWSRFGFGGYAAMAKDLEQRMRSSDTKEAELAKQDLAMVNQLYNNLAFLRSTEGKALFGAISAGDREMLNQIISDRPMNMSNVVHTLRILESGSSARLSNAVWQAPNPQSALVYMAKTRGQIQQGVPRTLPREGYGDQTAPPPRGK